MRMLQGLAALVVLLSAAGCGLEAIHLRGGSPKKDDGVQTLKLAAGGNGPGVELAGQETTIVEATQATCPQRAARNPGGEAMFWVPDGPARAYVDQQNRVRLIFPHHLAYALVGSSVEDAQLDCGDAISESSQNPNPDALDDASWPWAFYRLADGRAMTLYHMEYHSWAHPELALCKAEQIGYSWDLACPWYSAITWGIAQDGIHFTRPQSPTHVAARATATGYPRTTTGLGPSDHSGIMRNPIDGKYYVTFLARGMTDSGMCIMRANDLSAPDGWNILTSTGWNGDANVGVAACKGILPASQNAVPGSLSWSTFYGRAMQVTFAHPEGRDEGFYMYLANADLTAWEGPVEVMKALLPWGTNGSIPNAAIHAYPSILSIRPDATGNFDQVGDEAWLFFVRTFNNDPSARRTVERVRVRFHEDGGERHNTVAPARGVYRVAGGGHYSNGVGAYCDMRSMEQLRGCGWSEAFERLPEFSNHSNYTNQGLCQCGLENAGIHADGGLVAGCYRIGAAGFYSNGTGQSCALLGQNLPENCGTSDFQSLRERQDHGTNQQQGACILPRGCYKVGAAGFYSNGDGHSCPFLWDQMPGICGHQNWDALKALESHGGNAQDGQCH